MKSETGIKNKEARKTVSEGRNKEISIPLLTFTFFFSISIYTLLLSFFIFQSRTDIKPEK